MCFSRSRKSTADTWSRLVSSLNFSGKGGGRIYFPMSRPEIGCGFEKRKKIEWARQREWARARGRGDKVRESKDKEKRCRLGNKEERNFLSSLEQPRGYDDDNDAAKTRPKRHSRMEVDDGAAGVVVMILRGFFSAPPSAASALSIWSLLGGKKWIQCISYKTR